MKSMLRKIVVALTVIAAPFFVHAQQVNPATDIRWPAITGNGSPTSLSIPCTALNYGQPYEDVSVSPSHSYKCGILGWENSLSVTGTISSAAVVSGSVNGVLDLKADFGATGSQRTMTCTSNATNVMPACSGGDFAVGNGVYIQNAGVLPTISTPSAPTVACVAQNGGACSGTITTTATGSSSSPVITVSSSLIGIAPGQTVTATNITIGTTVMSVNGTAVTLSANPTGTVSGSITFTGVTHTYCYQIAAIQSAPNGAMTAASAPSCVTQMAQTYQALINDTQTPGTWTTVVLPSGTNILLYAVYKNIDGGAYSWYALPTPQTFSDYNDHASIFTYADAGVPSTPPVSAVPNDVYAIITGITGSTYTLSPWTAQPKYNQNGGDGQLSGFPYYPSVPSVSGTVTIQHDDTPAMYAWSQAMRASGGNSQLHIPAGKYNLHSADPYGHGAMVHLNGIYNVTIAGDGDSSQLLMTNDRANRYSDAFHAVCGYNTLEPTGNCIGAGFAGLGLSTGTQYNIVDPAPKGNDYITLSTPSQYTNFTVGGYVIVGINATGYSPYAQEMYAELNKVKTIDPVTGRIGLAYPLNKYYSATLIAPYSLCGSNCAGAQPYISPINPSPSKSVFDHLIMRDFFFHGLTIFENIDVVDYLTESHLTIETNEKMSEGIGRHFYISNENLTEDSGIWGQGTFFSTAAAASGDMLVTSSHYVNKHFGNNSQMCSEGSVTVVYKDNTFDISGAMTGNGGNMLGLGLPFGAGALSYGCEFSHNTVNVSGTHLDYLVRTSDPTGSTFDHDNTINVDSVGTGTSSVETTFDGPTQANANGNINIGINWWSFATGFGPKVNGNNLTLSGLTSQALPTCVGSIPLYPQYTTASILTCAMTGNITGFNLGSTRVPGLRFWIAFTQPSSGGPYTLPAACSSWGAVMDCGSLGAPVANPAASSTTYVELQDDGTTVHFLSSNYKAATNSFTGILISALPSAAASTNLFYPITNGLTTSDCTTGGGSNGVLCWSNGSAWTAVGGGGSGSSTGPVPAWATNLASGVDGSNTNASGNFTGEYWYTNFTVPFGNTVSTNNWGFVIHATGTCTIAGTINLQSANSTGLCGGAGGGSGGGTAAGTIGGGSFWGFTTTGASGSGGSAGGTSGGNGGNAGDVAGTGNSGTIAKSCVNSGVLDGFTWGGAQGKAGGSSGGAAGLGAGGIVLICSQITGTDGTHIGTINAGGGNGTPAAANSTGSGSGGGGAPVILSSVQPVTTWPNIYYSGGPGALSNAVAQPGAVLVNDTCATPAKVSLTTSGGALTACTVQQAGTQCSGLGTFTQVGTGGGSGGTITPTWQTATPTGTFASGSLTITVSSGTGIVQGMSVTGTGIPAGAYVAKVSGTTVTLNNYTTASGSGVSLTFTGGALQSCTATGGTGYQNNVTYTTSGNGGDGAAGWYYLLSNGAVVQSNVH